MTRLLLGTLVAVCALGMLSVAVSGQAPGNTAPSAERELLMEIRGLRADLTQAMSANIRAQLLVGRLQLQEQRMNTLSTQLAEVRRLLADQDAERMNFVDQMSQMTKALESGSLEQEQRTDIEQQLGAMKQELTRFNPKLQELRAQESDLSGQLVAEQGRWIDFNTRLDEIERSLPQAPR